MNDADTVLAVVGTYSDVAEDGLYSYRLDQETGALDKLDATSGGEDPSFVAFHSDGEYLYTVSETSSGTVRSFNIDAETGALTQINVVDSGGAGPCHCSVVGQYVVVAHYVSGVVSLLPIGDDGRIKEPVGVVKHKGASVHPERQTQPHPHSAVSSSDGRYVYVPDLGTDQIISYRLDAEEGELRRSSSVRMPDGAGPRHFTVDAGGDVAYVINELDSTIGTLDLDLKSGDLSVREVVSTLPDDATEENTTADIHLHPSGKWLYGSNRGHDSIAVFNVDADGGLTIIGHEPTRGQWPRNFAVDPAGEWLFAENMRSDSVVTFSIDQADGTMTATESETTVSEPTCMKFR